MGKKKVANNYKYHNVPRRAGLRSSKNKLSKTDRIEIEKITKCLEKILYEGEDIDLEVASNYLNIVTNMKKRCIDTYDLQVCEKLESQLQRIVHTIVNTNMDTQNLNMSQNSTGDNNICNEIILGTQKMDIHDESVIVSNDVNMCQQIFPVDNTDSQETFCFELETSQNEKSCITEIEKVPEINSVNKEACSNTVKECADTLIHSQDLLTVYENASNSLITQMQHSKPCTTQRKRKKPDATYTEYYNITPDDPKNTAYSEQLIYMTTNEESQIKEVRNEISSDNQINNTVDINDSEISKINDNIFEGFLTKTDNTQTVHSEKLTTDYQKRNNYSSLSVPNKAIEPVVNHNLSDHVQENPVKIIRTNTVINRLLENQIRPCDNDKQILQTDNLNYAHAKTSIATNSYAVQCSENQNTEADLFSETEFTTNNVKKDSATEQFSEPYSNISYNPVITKSTLKQPELNPSLGINKENICNTGAIPKRTHTTILTDDKDGFKFDTGKSLLANIKEARKTIIDHVKELRDTYRSSRKPFCTINHDFGKGNDNHDHTSLFHKPEHNSSEAEISTQTQMEQNNPKVDPYSDLQQYLNTSVLQNVWRDNRELPNVATDLSMKDLIYNWNKLNLEK